MFLQRFRNLSINSVSLGKKGALAALFSLFFASCGNDKPRPEVVDKLRALGVKTTPVVAVPGDTVQFEFFVAGPRDRKPSVTFSLDQENKYGVALSLTQVGDVTETAYGKLSVYQFQGSTILSKALWTQLMAGRSEPGRGRYKALAQFQGDEEIIVGDVLVDQEGSTRPATSKHPQVTILEPSTSVGMGSDRALKAKLESAEESTTRMGWYVSGGEVKVRRAIDTEWKTPSETGEATVIVTARNRSTGAFGFQAVKIDVQ